LEEPAVSFFNLVKEETLPLNPGEQSLVPVAKETEWTPECFVGSGKGVPFACPDTTPKPSSSSQQLSNLPTEISQVQCSMYVYIQ
jgi:hypothetical protein